MNSDQNKRLNLPVVGTLAMLLIAAVVYLSVELGRNNRLGEKLKKEKVISETMLSEKLRAEKEVARITSELNELEKRYADSDRARQTTQQELALAKQELARSGSNSKLTANLKSRNQELLKSNEILQQRITANEILEAALKADNDKLALTLALTESETDDLRDRLQKLTDEGRSMRQSLIESTTKTHKLTVKAKRTKNITISGEMPSEIQQASFRIFDPKGNELKDAITSAYVSGVENKHADNSGFNRFQMTFKPTRKLVAGLYTIDIFNDAGNIGSLQVRLR